MRGKSMVRRRATVLGFAMAVVASAAVAGDGDVRFETTDGEALSDDKQEVAEAVLNLDVLQPGVYRLEVDVEARQARIIEAKPTTDPADSGHRTDGE